MASTGHRQSASTDAAGVTALLRDASFVHLFGHRNGDALAATGILGRALDELKIPHQVTFAETPRDCRERQATDSTVVGIGFESVGTPLSAKSSMAAAAFESASALETDPDPILAMAGVRAAGSEPSDALLQAAREAGAERRPGLGIPTDDPVTGLAYSTVFHGEFSGSETEAEAFLANLDSDVTNVEAARRLSSVVALHASDGTGADRTQEAISRGVAPMYVPGPFETAAGYGDVLEALARADVGLGYRFVLGYEDRSTALDTWKRYASDIHDAIEQLDDGDDQEDAIRTVSVSEIDPWTTARLAKEYRSTAPGVLVTGAEYVALATTQEDAAAWLSDATDAVAVAGRPDLAIADRERVDEPVIDRLEEVR